MPVVLISSIAMMMILLVSLTSITSLSSSINGQYQDKLINEAGEAGLAYVNSCLRDNSGTSSWTNLYPGASCSSTTASPCEATSPPAASASCWVHAAGSVRTTFKVGALSFDSAGKADISVDVTLLNIRQSTGSIQKSRTESKKVSIVQPIWKDLIVATGGNTYACGLTYEGQVFCWGDNTKGSLGDSTTTSHADPEPITTSSGTISSLRFNSITNGTWGSVCGITTAYDLYCWGNGDRGTLGQNNTTNYPYPRKVLNGANAAGKWLKVELLNYSACGMGATDSSGTSASIIYCWGQNTHRNLGNSSTTNSYTPVKAGVISSYTDFSGGSHHVCGTVSDGSLWCWGMRMPTNVTWYCTDPSPKATAEPLVSVCPGLGSRPIDNLMIAPGINLATVQEFSSSSDSGCLVYTNQEVGCFGANFKGQAGNGVSCPATGTCNLAAPSSSVLKHGTATTLKVKTNTIVQGSYSVCAIEDTTDAAYCWGWGIYNQLGNNSESDRTAAYAVSGGLTYRKLFPTGWGYCGLTTNSQVYCWGRTNGTLFDCPSRPTDAAGYRYCDTPRLAASLSKKPPKVLMY